MKILLGIGGGDDSFRALRQTLARANDAGDDLTIAILDNPDSDVTVEEIRERVTERVEESGVSAEIREVAGDPGSRLVAIADEEGFDRIVLGGGEKSPMGKIRVGPIAEFVLLNAQTTVTLVR